MNKKDAKKLLDKFQCDYNRKLEESFAQTLSENENVRLFFINENQAFTDGKNIVVDPADSNLYADEKALMKITDYLKLPRVVLTDAWNVLRIVTRAQTIHECLHIIYTTFPFQGLKDKRCDTSNKLKVMSLISNIIEDAYIEAAGCSVYDNMEFFLRFGRVSRLFASAPSEGTIDKAMENAAEVLKSSPPLITEYLNYIVDYVLYPMIRLAKPIEEIKMYVEETKGLFDDAVMAESPDDRYCYSCRIFDIILPLIPEDEKIDTNEITNKLCGYKTHSTKSSSIGDVEHRGKSQKVTTRLFVDAQGNERLPETTDEDLMSMLSQFARERTVALSIVDYEGKTSTFTGTDVNSSAVHSHIHINENYLKINLGLKKAYNNIYNKYKININSYNQKFSQLLQARAPVRDEKYIFGSGISSKMLSDPHKRYWYRTIEGIDVPDMAVMLIVDGSGSMYGARRESAIKSSVILHEVLKKQEITHAIVEHRASFRAPEIDINILVDFSDKDEQKYNLMQIDANGNNRDGLALYWAEQYINKKTNCENKLIIVLSDGIPAHGVDDYIPPISVMDTKNAVQRIIKNGTKVIAVALDDEDSFECYQLLSEIYPNLVGCNDLKKLTGQLLGVIARLI